MSYRQTNRVKDPQVLLYSVIRLLVTIFAKTVLKLKVITIDPIPARGPLIIVCSHGGYLDFLCVAAAVHERRLHFLSAEYYFQHKPLGWLLRTLGAIPKQQFYPDVNSIAAMMEVLRRGSAVVIFPAGQTSLDGTTLPIDPSIARLVRRAGVPVAALRIHGSFLTLNRFSRGAMNKGRIEIEKRVALTAEQVSAYDEKTIYDTLCGAVAFDDYEWQRSSGVLFKGKKRAQGYENILVRCPKCAEMYSCHADGNRIWCEACGNSADVGADMRFIPLNGSTVLADLQEWVNDQRTQIILDTDKEDFSLTSDVRVKSYGFSDSPFIGEGSLRMDRQGIRFKGVLDGKAAEFFVDHQILPGLTGKFGEYLYIPQADHGPLAFYLAQGKAVIEWKFAQEHLHSQTAASQH